MLPKLALFLSDEFCKTDRTGHLNYQPMATWGVAGTTYARSGPAGQESSRAIMAVQKSLPLSINQPILPPSPTHK